MANIKKVGLISDTHCRLAKKAFEALQGHYSPSQVYEKYLLSTNELDNLELKAAYKNLKSKPADLIIHAGDIGIQDIVNQLESIAPLIAVNGNCDFQTFKTLRGQTQDFEAFEYEGCGIAVTHRPNYLDSFIEGSFISPSQVDESLNIKLRIHGHTHESKIEIYGDDYTLICPGSASMGRYGTPNSVAFVYIANEEPVLAELVDVT